MVIAKEGNIQISLLLFMQQVAAISAGIANLTQMPDGIRRGKNVTSQGGGGTGDSRVWRTGDLEFESFMRMLDNKVGYSSHNSALFRGVPSFFRQFMLRKYILDSSKCP